MISLTERNAYWKCAHIVSGFERTLKETWLNDNLSICISESERYWNIYYKLGGITTIPLNKISSYIVQKGQDPSGVEDGILLQSWGEQIQRTTIFTMYRPCKSPIETVGWSTIIKQQWLLLKEKKRHEYPNLAAIRHTIETIKGKQKDGYKIIIVLDQNEVFTYSTGGIIRLCHECQLYNPFSHRYGDQFDSKFHIRGQHRIDEMFCSYNILTSIEAYGPT